MQPSEDLLLNGGDHETRVVDLGGRRNAERVPVSTLICADRDARRSQAAESVDTANSHLMVDQPLVPSLAMSFSLFFHGLAQSLAASQKSTWVPQRRLSSVQTAAVQRRRQCPLRLASVEQASHLNPKNRAQLPTSRSELHVDAPLRAEHDRPANVEAVPRQLLPLLAGVLDSLLSGETRNRSHPGEQ